MKVLIKEKECELKYGFRALMIYENITNKSFSPSGIGDMIVFFYSVLLASMKNCDVTLDEFIDWLDENPQVIGDFSTWLGDIYGINNKIKPISEDTKEAKKKVKITKG